VDAVALREDEGAHLWIPAPGLVSEVDASLEQLLHGGCSQVNEPPVVPPPASGPMLHPALPGTAQRGIRGRV